MRERPWDLVGAGDAEARDAMRARGFDLLTRECDAAAIGTVVAGNDIDERRLARAIRPDEAEDLAAADFDIDARKRLHAGKRLAHAGRRQQWGQVLNWGVSMRQFKT